MNTGRKNNVGELDEGTVFTTGYNRTLWSLVRIKGVLEVKV
jgi:hypothetical protein